MTFSLSRRAAMILGCTALAAGLQGCRRPVALTFHGTDVTGSVFGQDLRLPDADGRERTLADFKGKAVLVFFGFTQCPDVCPTALTRAVEIKKLLGADCDWLQVLFVTIDPERDTPAVLKAYMAAFDPAFVALHGTTKQVATTARAFKIFYEKVPTGDSYTMDHSSISYVFDPQGRLRLALSHSLSAVACADDLRKLLHPA